MSIAPYLLLASALVLSACSGDSDGRKADTASEGASSGEGSAERDSGSASPEDAESPEAEGDRSDAGSSASIPSAFAVGTQRLEFSVSASRTLPVQIWYPAEERARASAEKGRPIQDFEPAGEKRDALDKLVVAAPDKCTNKTMHAADAPAVFGSSKKWPLIVFSHCMDCTRFSMFSVAEHLVSLGFVVVAPDHVGGTVYENKGVLDSDFLKVREADIRGVLDIVLDDNAKALPVGLRGRIDAERVAAMGHSYGSVTTGLVLQNDARVKAAVFIAAPPESPLLSGASVQKLQKPALYIEAMEDHSIQLVGNGFLENNFSSHPVSAWLLKVADAGHWSFSDICALIPAFKPGCGMDTRQNPLQGGSFTYLDIDQARGIAKEYISAFFAMQLLGDTERGKVLERAEPEKIVKIEHHD